MMRFMLVFSSVGFCFGMLNNSVNGFLFQQIEHLFLAATGQVEITNRAKNLTFSFNPKKRH